jgi:hypothetical protein
MEMDLAGSAFVARNASLFRRKTAHYSGKARARRDAGQRRRVAGVNIRARAPVRRTGWHKEDAMRALIGLLAAAMTLSGVAAQTGRDKVDATEAAAGSTPHAKGKRIQAPTKGKRVKTTLPPRKGKKG